MDFDEKNPLKKRFAIHFHDAKKAGPHYDIRIQLPVGKNWDSFATKKDIPLDQSKKIYVYRSRWHSEKEALFTGEIEGDVYGAGTLSLWDEGDVLIEKYNKRHMIMIFKGKKIKGRYHFLSSYYAKFGNRKNINRQQYKAFLFFKAKIQD